jgi:hypothetical protein
VQSLWVRCCSVSPVTSPCRLLRIYGGGVVERSNGRTPVFFVVLYRFESAVCNKHVRTCIYTSHDYKSLNKYTILRYSKIKSKVLASVWSCPAGLSTGTSLIDTSKHQILLASFLGVLWGWTQYSDQFLSWIKRDHTCTLAAKIVRHLSIIK